MLRDGLGQAADPAGSRNWLEAAAGQGYVRAYYPVAELYFNAPPDPETGLWTGPDLAKAYMWLSATLQRSVDPVELDRAKEMLDRVREVMPGTWVQELDARVAGHLAAQVKPTP